MATELYMPENAEELRSVFLRDVRLSAIDSGMADPPVTPGTDWWYLATAISNMGLLGFANVNASEAAYDVLTATGDELDNIRKGLGLPEVPAAPATGKIVVTATGSATLSADSEFIYPNGLRGKVTATTSLAAGDTEVAATAIDAGAATNLQSGEKVRFVSPPVNMNTEAKVSTGEPLTGGTDAESDVRKRDRILNTLRNKPAGGNWAHLRQIALDALGTVQDCYVYPALGGPGSCKVVPVKDFDLATNDFSRALSSTAIETVRAEIQANVPGQDEIVVESAADEQCDATILVEIPDSVLAGGNGLGWTDAAPWPPLVVADSSTVAITGVGTTSDVITVDAATTTSPVAGQTHIAWWSSADRLFYQALVTAVSGSTTNWTLTLDRPLVGKFGAVPVAGDYISPACVGMVKYGAAWVDTFRTLGPGENTTDSNRLPRAKRHPFAINEDPFAITNAALTNMVRLFPEITDISYGVRSPSTPTVPTSVSGAPNILVPRKFAIYKQV